MSVQNLAVTDTNENIVKSTTVMLYSAMNTDGGKVVLSYHWKIGPMAHGMVGGG